MKKRLLIAAALLILVLICAACAETTSGQIERITPTEAPAETAAPTPAPTAAPTEEPQPEAEPTPSPVVLHEYVLNNGTMKFHKPSCSSVKDIKEENKQTIEATREEVIEMGYSPCGRCHP